MTRCQPTRYAPGTFPSAGIVVPHDLVHKFLRALEQEQGRSPETVKAYRNAYRWFWQHLHSQGLRARKVRITRDHVRDWIAAMRTKGLAPQTIRVRLAAVSALFGWMYREGLLRGNPVAGIPRPRAPKWSPRGALTPIQAGRLWAAAATDRRPAGQQNRVGLLLLWHCGGRRGEVLGARWEDFDLRKRAWMVRGKGDKIRWVGLTEMALVHLVRLWEQRGRPPGGPILLARTRQPLSRTSFHGTIKRYCRLAGVPKASAHWLRHTFVSELAERASSPADIRKIQLMAGHASIETTMGYMHVFEEDLKLLDRTFGVVPPPEVAPTQE